MQFANISFQMKCPKYAQRSIWVLISIEYSAHFSVLQTAKNCFSVKTEIGDLKKNIIKAIAELH